MQAQFIDAALSKDKLQAETMFKSMMAEKVREALDARRIELAQTLYNRVQGQ